VCHNKLFFIAVARDGTAVGDVGGCFWDWGYGDFERGALQERCCPFVRHFSTCNPQDAQLPLSSLTRCVVDRIKVFQLSAMPYFGLFAEANPHIHTLAPLTHTRTLTHTLTGLSHRQTPHCCMHNATAKSVASIAVVTVTVAA